MRAEHFAHGAGGGLAAQAVDVDALILVLLTHQLLLLLLRWRVQGPEDRSVRSKSMRPGGAGAKEQIGLWSQHERQIRGQCLTEGPKTSNALFSSNSKNTEGEILLVEVQF